MFLATETPLFGLKDNLRNRHFCKNVAYTTQAIIRWPIWQHFNTKVCQDLLIHFQCLHFIWYSFIWFTLFHLQRFQMTYLILMRGKHIWWIWPARMFSVIAAWPLTDDWAAPQGEQSYPILCYVSYSLMKASEHQSTTIQCSFPFT